MGIPKLNIIEGDTITNNDIYLISPRKIRCLTFTENKGTLTLVLEYAETVDEWVKRCTRITNIKL